MHTLDLRGEVCYCGHVHVAPTHTITTLVQPLAWWRERPMPGTPLAPWSPIPMCSASRRRTLSPEWADWLWELAQRPERPSLEPSRKLRVRVDPRLPPDWIVPRYDFSDVLFAPWRTNG